MTAILLSAVLPLLLGGPNGVGSKEEYIAGIKSWRQQQEIQLTSEDGWLSVAGLVWLSEGGFPLGTSPFCTIRLPDASAPDMVGTLTMRDGNVSFKAAEGVTVKIDGKPTTAADLKPDQTTLTVNALRLMVIKRGSRIGLRMYDPNSRARKEFKGQKWFAADPKYRIHAIFTPYDPVKKMPITNVLGDTADVTCPGFVTFTLAGKQCRLEAQDAGDGLFFNFRDLTTGKSTYPAGRFMDAPRPVNGMVALDFNKATNPAMRVHVLCNLSVAPGDELPNRKHPSRRENPSP